MRAHWGGIAFGEGGTSGILLRLSFSLFDAQAAFYLMTKLPTQVVYQSVSAVPPLVTHWVKRG